MKRDCEPDGILVLLTSLAVLLLEAFVTARSDAVVTSGSESCSNFCRIGIRVSSTYFLCSTYVVPLLPGLGGVMPGLGGDSLWLLDTTSARAWWCYAGAWR